MASRRKKGMALRRKLDVLRKLTNSKSVNMTSVIMDAFLYICKLKLQIEAIRKEYLHLLNNIQEVKVEKLGKGFQVRVACKKGQDLLVSILEAFEGMGLDVLHAKVSCNYFFGMVAIVEAHQDQAIDVRDVTQAVVKAIQKQREVGTYSSADAPSFS
ncbi:hypothetical protein RJ639_011070 [Escallonia herrerae]|uniref:Plant bHLH transcription factor ACT-like domain-containing protein n=1 Tax=Escallonia herrerae TaxID=1293975 RepID=A0AA88VLL2_9ASTE|nr:hypothetical protein RJ639_011070 [Escallonia herrerae]